MKEESKTMQRPWNPDLKSFIEIALEIQKLIKKDDYDRARTEELDRHPKRLES